MQKRGNILIIDDEEDIYRDLNEGIKAHNLFWAKDLTGVNDRLSKKNIDLTIIDLNLKGDPKSEILSGLDYIKKIHERYPLIPIIVLSKYSDIERISTAIKNGAQEYIWKGAFDADTPEFREKLNDYIKKKHKIDEIQNKLKSEIIGSSHATCILRQQIEELSKSRKSFFLIGKPGSGKENVVHYLHYKSIHYMNSRELLKEDLALGNSEEIISSLKYKPESKTSNFIKKAQNNLFYIQHIESTDFEVQNAFLQIIRSKQYLNSSHPLQIQFVFSLEEDPRTLIEEGKLYPELYHDLINVKIEALKDRVGDLYDLIPKWLELNEYPKDIFTPEAIKLLLNYDYPGNLIELYSILKQALDKFILKYPNNWKNKKIDIAFLPQTVFDFPLEDLSYMLYEVAKIELKYIDRALQKHQGRKGDAAEALRIPSGADNLKKSYIDKYNDIFPELIRCYPEIVKSYKLE